jgi:hypothetical protein
MADYYPLVAKAVAGLEKNTGEGRRVLYERARSALVAQLRGMNDPPLTEAEITRERLALEEAIRKVEAEAARRGRDAPRPEAPAAPKPETEVAAAPPKSAPPPADRPTAPVRPRTPSRTVTEEGMKGFRDVIAEAEALGNATAQGAKTAREAYAATPPTGQPAFDRVEPRVEPEGLRGPSRPTGRTEPAARSEPAPRAEPPARLAPLSPFDGPAEPGANWAEPERIEPRAAQQRQGPMRAPSADDIGDLPRGSRAGLIAAILVVLLIIGLGVAAYWQRERIAQLVGAVRGQPQQQQQQNAGAQKPKIADRVGQPAAATDTPAAPANPNAGAAPAAAVAQRVALYEEDPSDQQGKRFVGSAIWRLEAWTASPGATPDPAIRCDIEIPERRITMSMLIHRDINQVQQATSHTIEITFNLPADFPFGGIQNVPGVLMKQAEQTRGSPLGGAAAKVTSGFFLIGLSAVETDMQRNIQLLKERSWFDIPIVYNNGRRAILAVEKGTPGERVFEETFKAWGQ